MQNEEDERRSWLSPSAPHGRKQLSGIAETHVQAPTRSTFRPASLVSYSHDGATRLSFNFDAPIDGSRIFELRGTSKSGRADLKAS